MHPADNPLYEHILQAAQQAGVPRVDDVNHGGAEGGMGYQPRTIWGGQRQSAAKAFLAPARGRPNLTVRTGVQVQRLLFDGLRASGVAVTGPAGATTIRARREVVLCAGALHSPTLLQRSGIGPAEWLQPLGIPVLVDSTGVGRHLMEHRCLMMQIRLRGGSLNAQFHGWRLGRSVLQYLARKTGPMTLAAHELCALVKTRPGLVRPDGELGIGLYSLKV
ncbi:MAG: oxidoreductase, partial [Pseudomonas sp. PGPPP3]